MNATEFRKALTVDVPRTYRQQAQQIMFDVGSQLHEAVVKGPPETPVKTGYLRSSLAFTVGGESPPPMEARSPTAVEGEYASKNPSPISALTRAVKNLLPFTIGFRADYAIYVEDKVGMVKTAHARAGQMIALAIANARSRR